MLALSASTLQIQAGYVSASSLFAGVILQAHITGSLLYVSVVVLCACSSYNVLTGFWEVEFLMPEGLRHF